MKFERFLNEESFLYGTANIPRACERKENKPTKGRGEKDTMRSKAPRPLPDRSKSGKGVEQPQRAVLFPQEIEKIAPCAVIIYDRKAHGARSSKLFFGKKSELTLPSRGATRKL